MWRPHVSQLVPGLALLAARHRPSWRVLAVAGVVVAPLLPGPRLAGAAPGPATTAARPRPSSCCGTLPDGALAISDDPGLVWRAGRRTPPDLVDASVLRIQTGDITSDVLAEVAGRARRVRRRRPQRASAGAASTTSPTASPTSATRSPPQDGDVRRVYVKPDCHP